jgi:PAS domain S-box-containing protein
LRVEVPGVSPEDGFDEISQILEAFGACARVDPQGRYLAVGSRHAQLLRYRPEKMIGCDWLASVHPEDLARVREVLRAVPAGEAGKVEARVIRRDGSVFRTQIVLIRPPGNYATGDGYLVLKDVSAAQSKERELTRRSAEFRLLVDQIPAAVWTVDRYLRLTSSAGAPLASADRAPHQEVGRTLYDYFQTRAEEFLPIAMHRQALQGHAARFDLEWLGHSFDVRVNPLHGADGKVVGAAGIAVDVTERKHWEVLRRATEEQFRLILEAIPDVVWKGDQQGNLLFLSAEARRVFGWTAEEVGRPGGKTCWEGVHPEDLGRLQTAYAALFILGRAFDLEYRLQRGDGQWVWLRSRVALFQAGGTPQALGLTSDITWQKQQADEAARHAEALAQASLAYLRQTQILHSILESIVEGVVVADEHDRILFTNRAASDILVYPLSQFQSLQDRWADHLGICFPDRQTPCPRDQNALVRAQRGEVIHDVELFVRSPGRPEGMFLSVTATPLKDPAGSVRGGVVAFRDVTERRRMEEALRQSEQQYREIFENSPLGIYRTTPGGRLLMANPALVHLLGYASVTELPTDDMDLLFIGVPGGCNRLREVLGRDVEVRGWESAWQTRDGRTIFVREHARAVRAADGAILYYEGHVEDITERKNAERALRQEKEFVDSLIDTAQAIILVLNPVGGIVRFNPYCEEVTGYQLADVKGQDWLALLTPAADQFALRVGFCHALAYSRAVGGVHPLCTRDGSVRQVDWRLKTLHDTAGQALGVLAIGHDITELKEAQRQALQSARLATIGEMIASLAHEGRNALQGALAGLDRLARRTQDQPELLDLVGHTRREQLRLHHLFDDVRGYVGSVTLQPSTCDLRQVWRRAWEQLHYIHQCRAGVLQETVGAVDLTCTADAFRLEQVFRNLLENALAACGDPFWIEIAFVETDLDGQAALRLAVRDNGPGLNAEQRRRVFEPFYTTKAQGIGLGMAICRRLVEAHGGRITVGDDAPNGGAEIVILLPRGKA